MNGFFQLEQTFPGATACAYANWGRCHRAARDDVDGSSRALPEDLGLGQLLRLTGMSAGSNFPLFRVRQDQARDHPLRECFRSGAAVQCHRSGALGQDRDLPGNGALMVESAGSRVAIENAQGLGLLCSQSHSEPPTSTRLW